MAGTKKKMETEGNGARARADPVGTTDGFAAKADAAGGSGDPEARQHVCSVGFCPIGMALTTVQGSRPEAVAHLMSAGRDFLLAAKAVLDARAEDVAGENRLERIEVG